MSDVSQGPGWWQASNHKWYPPHLHADNLSPTESSPTEKQHGARNGQEVGGVVRVIGALAGIVGVVGFFLNFLSVDQSSLSSAGSGWFDLVPVFIGISLLALFVPKYGFIFSGWSLVSLGIVFGLRGVFTGIGASFLNIESFLSGIAPAISGHRSSAGQQTVPFGLGYGVGFWMIVVGSGVLAIAWIALLAIDRN